MSVAASPENGYFPAGDDRSGTDDAVRSRARMTYLRLRDGIIHGHIPPLRKLKISELAIEMNVNSSAVREALSRLTAEHLVEARDQQGFRVAPISLAELDDLTRTRIDIETLALGRAVQQGDRSWEQRLRRAHRALKAFRGSLYGPDGAALHAEFHEALVAGCRSASLLRIRNSLYELTDRYRAIATRYAAATRNVADEHDEIAAAALARDADRATEALESHIRTTADLVREAIGGAVELAR